MAFGVRLLLLVEIGFEVNPFKVYSPGPGISLLFSGIKDPWNLLVLLEKGAKPIEVLFIVLSKYSPGPKLFCSVFVGVKRSNLDPKNCLNSGVGLKKKEDVLNGS